MKRTIIILALPPLLLAGCQRGASLPASGTYGRGTGSYDRDSAGLMEKWNLPGGAPAVIKDGQHPLARGYGLTDVGRAEADAVPASSPG